MTSKNKRCQHCLDLRGKGRRDKGHEYLVFKDSKDVSCMLGTADEKYYTCSICGHDWLHETGNYGMGWVE